MVILEVFSKNIVISYKSTFVSKATLLALTFGVVTVVLPFVIAYKSKGFWIKRDVFYEQPDIKFRGEYIFFASTNNLSKPVITCSTLPPYEQTLEFLDTCSTIKIREIDENFDNKVDEFNLNLQINLPEETQLTSVNLVVPLEYKLHICPVHMQAAIIFQMFLPLALSHYMIFGDVITMQTSPLFCHKRKINNFYNYSIISNGNDINSYKLDAIIKEYSRRNISTTLTNVYTSFALGKTRKFNMDLKIRYPEDNIYYRPGFWQIMKWAWVQYLAIYNG
ncbi:transmembrane protein 231 [Tenebrio molitor]|uniref:transmembrane protein 231 n=1 Tax=Tenebrio molitor TaxID=7067 RepID=UPI003624A2B1